MRELSKLYTKPSEDPNEPPHNKYTLRGVSTEHSTTYVLERTRPIESEDILSAEPTDWQWWKIKFSAGDANPVSYTVSSRVTGHGDCLKFFLVIYRKTVALMSHVRPNVMSANMVLFLQKVREVEVLKAAKEESQNALLVYASEKAVSYENQNLPQQLLVICPFTPRLFHPLTISRILSEPTILISQPSLTDLLFQNRLYPLNAKQTTSI